LETIQSRLLDVGSAVATPAEKASEKQLTRVQFDATATTDLEQWIDAMDEDLEPLRNFILPSGPTFCMPSSGACGRLIVHTTWDRLSISEM
jgi:cob(I)alamin adenosyltransferase